MDRGIAGDSQVEDRGSDLYKSLIPPDLDTSDSWWILWARYYWGDNYSVKGSYARLTNDFANRFRLKACPYKRICSEMHFSCDNCQTKNFKNPIKRFNQ